MDWSVLRFVIIEDDDFIAGDMAVGLGRACPDAAIVRVRRGAEVGAVPEAPGCLSVFITSAPLSEIDASGLAERARATGAEIVVREGLDSNAAVEARGYYSLRAPFTDAALLAVTQAFRDCRAA